MTIMSSINRRCLFWLASAMVLAALFLMGQLIYQNLFLKKELKNLNPSAISVSAADAAPVQFDFYTVLPKMTVDSEIKTITPPIPHYFLKIASTKQVEEAQRLRDQLQIWGFPVFIHPNLNDQSAKYQILLGPYQSLAEAQHAQGALHTHKTDSSLLKN